MAGVEQGAGSAEDDVSNGDQFGGAPASQIPAPRSPAQTAATLLRKTQNVLAHMHLTYFIPNSHLCACSTCSLVSFSSDQDAVNYAVLLMQGSFQVGQDAAGLKGEGPVSMNLRLQNGAIACNKLGT